MKLFVKIINLPLGIHVGGGPKFAFHKKSEKYSEPTDCYTTQKIKFSIKDFFSKCDQILNGKLHFLCSVNRIREFALRRFFRDSKYMYISKTALS